MVRFVLRQTNPCVRNNSETHWGVKRTPVFSNRYSASRGAVHRVNAYPNSRGSRRTARTISLMYDTVALGGRPARSASSNPKCRRFNQRRFQFSSVLREMARDSKILCVASPAANKSTAVIRFHALRDSDWPRWRSNARLSEAERRTPIADGMACFPSLPLRRGVYHA